MNTFLYNLVLHTVVPPVLSAYYLPRILFQGKYRRSLPGKLGRLDPAFNAESIPTPRLWFHAVSVGEVVALSPLVKALKELLPSAGLVVSTGTETGQDRARALVEEADGFLYLPLDFPSFVRPVVERIRPDLFIMMETELWPNLIRILKKRNATIALANGRISDRSFPRYRLMRGFFEPTLEKMDLFLMSSELDASRIRDIGVPQERIRVTGNTKFDAALANTPREHERQMREVLGIEQGERVFIAGSTHPGENEIVLHAYQELLKTFPELILVLAPRHVEKTPQILTIMQERGMAPAFLRSSADRGEHRNGRKVVIIDRTGELFQMFSLASVVFMGGSLVPRGGQNILEPAAWGKVVLFGPSMEDFRDAKEILVRTGAGVEISGADDLAARVSEFLADPEKAALVGRTGRDELARHTGSARRTAKLLADFLLAKDSYNDRFG